MRTILQVAFIIIAILSVYPPPSTASEKELTANVLADYVAEQDTAYEWKVKHEGTYGVTRYVEFILTSQVWREKPWKHQLFVLMPSTAKPQDTSHFLLVVGGGNWKDELEVHDDNRKFPKEAPLIAAGVELLGMPVAILLHVPQQPMLEGRSEDALIAYTLDKFVETGDSDWPLLLPMVKSVVRAMDTVAKYAEQQWSVADCEFIVGGASKRGWTTWLTGAIDKRVAGVVPIAFDMLNMDAQLRHQKAVWGDYSSKIQDYTKLGLHNVIGSDQGDALRRIVDPHSYRRQITCPKLIVVGTNDEYWPVDALNHYWDDLPDNKYILYVPNNTHEIRDYRRVVGTLITFTRRIAESQLLPKISWNHAGSQERHVIEVRSDERPHEVRAWMATSASRDFRKASWKSSPMKRNGDKYSFELNRPTEGYMAVYGEASYAPGRSLLLSTTMAVISSTENKEQADP